MSKGYYIALAIFVSFFAMVVGGGIAALVMIIKAVELLGGVLC